MSKNKAKKIDIREEIVFKAFELAAEIGWDNVRMQEIASSCDMSLEELQDVIMHKDDVLVLFGHMVDKKMLAGIAHGENGSAVSAREQIFDALMERYDILNEHRAGLLCVIYSFKNDPKQAVFSMPQICRSMNMVLEGAGVETSGIYGALKVTGLTGLYLRCLKVWMDDESDDLSKTMSALDKALDRIESVLNSFGH
jgi:hypothetical protein